MKQTKPKINKYQQLEYNKKTETDFFNTFKFNNSLVFEDREREQD